MQPLSPFSMTTVHSGLGTSIVMIFPWSGEENWCWRAISLGSLVDRYTDGLASWRLFVLLKFFLDLLSFSTLTFEWYTAC